MKVTFESEDGVKVVRNIRPSWNVVLSDAQSVIESFKKTKGIDVEDLKNVIASVISHTIDEEFVVSVLDELTDKFREVNRRVYYWSRQPGAWVDPKTGERTSTEQKFTGTVREWYETLTTTIVDATNDATREKRRDPTLNVSLRAGEVAMPIIESLRLYDSYTNTLRPFYDVSSDDRVEPNVILLGDFAKVVIIDYKVDVVE